MPEPSPPTRIPSWQSADTTSTLHPTVYANHVQAQLASVVVSSQTAYELMHQQLQAERAARLAAQANVQRLGMLLLGMEHVIQPSIGDHLVAAACAGLADVLAHHLATGANPNTLSRNGNNALHATVLGDHADILSALLAHPQADPNYRNANGSSPLHLATVIGNASAIEALLQSPGIDPNLPCANGNTALHMAAFLGFSDAIELLINHPATRLEKRNAQSQTAQDLAHSRGQIRIAQRLLEAGRIRTVAASDTPAMVSTRGVPRPHSPTFSELIGQLSFPRRSPGAPQPTEQPNPSAMPQPPSASTSLSDFLD